MRKPNIRISMRNNKTRTGENATSSSYFFSTRISRRFRVHVFSFLLFVMVFELHLVRRHRRSYRMGRSDARSYRSDALNWVLREDGRVEYEASVLVDRVGVVLAGALGFYVHDGGVDGQKSGL